MKKEWPSFMTQTWFYTPEKYGLKKIKIKLGLVQKIKIKLRKVLIVMLHLKNTVTHVYCYHQKLIAFNIEIWNLAIYAQAGFLLYATNSSIT